MRGSRAPFVCVVSDRATLRLYMPPRGDLVDGLPRAPSNLTKIKIALSPVVRSALKPSQVGFDMYRIGWCARESQENSVA